MITNFLEDIIKVALAELANDPIPIHTLAFYHDHESSAVEICADTKESSMKSVRQGNKWAMKYFAKHIRNGEWEDASRFPANIGRSLSLGDFARVGVARTKLDPSIVTDDAFYLAMARTLIAHQKEILEMSPVHDEVIFCCSGSENEVELVWSALE